MSRRIGEKPLMNSQACKSRRPRASRHHTPALPRPQRLFSKPRRQSGFANDALTKLVRFANRGLPATNPSSAPAQEECSSRDAEDEGRGLGDGLEGGERQFGRRVDAKRLVGQPSNQAANRRDRNSQPANPINPNAPKTTVDGSGIGTKGV